MQLTEPSSIKVATRQLSGRTALVYLARGADADSPTRIRRFLDAYTGKPTGVDHDLVVIFKGFATTESLNDAKTLFAGFQFTGIDADDASFDIGAYKASLRRLDCERVCFLNTNSEPVAENWLLKLALNLERPGVGLVGASGSFEVGIGSNTTFPNVHIRSNAFMLRLLHARPIFERFEIKTKEDAYLAEHGPNSITCQTASLGLSCLVVGRNGRGYSPAWWRGSKTFRQGDQGNLLVHDNQTRQFAAYDWRQKKRVCAATWGAAPTPGPPFLGPTS